MTQQDITQFETCDVLTKMRIHKVGLYTDRSDNPYLGISLVSDNEEWYFHRLYTGAPGKRGEIAKMQLSRYFEVTGTGSIECPQNLRGEVCIKLKRNGEWLNVVKIESAAAASEEPLGGAPQQSGYTGELREGERRAHVVGEDLFAQFKATQDKHTKLLLAIAKKLGVGAPLPTASAAQAATLDEDIPF